MNGHKNHIEMLDDRFDGSTMPKRRRKAPEVHIIECDVELSQPLSHELASTISQDICKHILFMRNQIPRLYNELTVNTEVSHSACPAVLYLGLHVASHRHVLYI